MKALIFILVLAIMPMVFSQTNEPLNVKTVKVDSLTFDAEKFSKNVDLTLAAYKKDSTTIVEPNKQKTKALGKSLILQIAEYASAIITALTLIFKKP